MKEKSNHESTCITISICFQSSCLLQSHAHICLNTLERVEYHRQIEISITNIVTSRTWSKHTNWLDYSLNSVIPNELNSGNWDLRFLVARTISKERAKTAIFVHCLVCVPDRSTVCRDYANDIC